MANVFASISSVLGPTTAVEVEEDYCIRTNAYLLLIAVSGSGKSQTFEKLFLKPLRTIEKKEKITFLMEEFTPSGFCKFLVDNNGYGVFGSDEFCQTMRSKMNSRHEENQAFRSQLCKFYNGQGVLKAYAFRAPLKVEEIYLTVYGVTQPHPYAVFHQELSSLRDGLLSRFLVLCSSPLPEDNFEESTEENLVLPQNLANASVPYSEIVTPFLTTLFSLHGNRKRVSYQFSLEASEYITGLRKLGLEAKKAAYQAAEEKLRDGTLAAGDVPNNTEYEKDFNYVVKYAAILHVLQSAIEEAVQKRFADIRISNVIQKSTVKRASVLVTTLQGHQREFSKLFQDNVISDKEATQIDNVLKDDTFLLQKIILCFPGKLVSSQMIIRKNRNIHSRSMELPKIMSQLHRTLASSGYVSQYKIVDRNKHVFYKTAPETVDKEQLQSMGITEHEYAQAYYEEQTEPPCSGFRNWATYLQNLKDAAPDDV